MSKQKALPTKLLFEKGYTEGPDGIWRKAGTHPDSPSGANPEPDQKKQKRRARKKSKRRTTSRLVAIVTVRSVRPRDYDGLGASAKHYLDALIQECGFCEDDSPDNLEVLAVPEPVGSFQEEETLIEIWEIPLDEGQAANG